MFPFPLAELDGCRAPALLLHCCGSFYSLCYPKWFFPGGGAAAALCRFFVGGEVDARRDLIAFCVSFRVLFTYYWVVLCFPLFGGPPYNCVDVDEMKLSPGPSRPVYRSKKTAFLLNYYSLHSQG
jgi:hypothetical protein